MSLALAVASIGRHKGIFEKGAIGNKGDQRDMTDTATDITRRVQELEANLAVRHALERAAQAIERLSGNRHYLAAFKAAARTIRNQKPD